MVKLLAIGPGAMGFFMFLGVLSSLNLDDLEEVSGASAGALLAFLYLAAKRDISKVLDYALTVPVKQVMKPSIQHFTRDYGLVSTSKLRKVFARACQHFLGKSDITFAELYEVVPIKLHISAHCVDLTKTVYFSIDSAPTMSVLDALAASVAIPFLFASVKLDGWDYIDGGWAETSPCAPFLGRLPEDVLVIKGGSVTFPATTDIKSFALNLIKSTMAMRHTYSFKTREVDGTGYDFFDFGMNSESKLRMFLAGQLQ